MTEPKEVWHRHLGAYGICLRQEDLLVIRKGGGPYIGRYDLPGGTVEEHETLNDAVIREFVEETGLKVRIERNLGVCDYIVPYALRKKGTSHIHHVAVFYLVQELGGVLAPKPDPFDGQDSLGALWVSTRDITEDNASPLVVQAVEWIKQGQLPVESKRLDDWVVISS
ncbi:NUDIX hydrolase [Paenibacillus vulneris]|uniref:NUDIX hydrolase n=1 Tax=Paenibacillus vulneris TaxID=1133364 RepID=A0ABW3UL71_9BACL